MTIQTLLTRFFSVAIGSALTFGGSLSAQDFRVYYVGNSLTVDSKPAHVQSTLRRAGITMTYGQHIRTGHGLTPIVAEPDIASPLSVPEEVAEFGTWQKGLGDFEWDAVSLQAYPGGDASEEVEATRQLIQTAIEGGRNAECVFYLYLAWPEVSETEGFSDRVLTEFRGENDRVFLNRGFLDYWFEEMTELFPDVDIRVIPTGIALAAMDEKLRDISVGGYTDAYSLYRDRDHLTLDAQHLTLTMMVGAFTQIDPDDYIFSEGYQARTNADFRAIAQDVAWHSLNADPRTKVVAPRELSLRALPDPDRCEISFVGALEASDDLDPEQWSPITGATSPYRFNMVEDRQFFRAR